MNIFEKLSAITNEIGTVGKDLKVSNYKAVSEGNILKAVKELENKYKVYSYPISRRVVSDELLEDNGKTRLFIRLETTYRFVNIEEPKEYIDIISYGTGLDAGDKDVGKAMTYSDKYALMKAYKIETGDDPDKEASIDTRYNRPAKPRVVSANASEATKEVIKRSKYYEFLQKQYGVNFLDDLSHEKGEQIINWLAKKGLEE